MELIDSHCHLDNHRFDGDRDQVIARALRAGVGRIIVPSIDANSCRKVLALSAQFEQIEAAIGLHPWFCNRHQQGDIQLLESRIRDAIAVGECGVDCSRRSTLPIEEQLLWLHPQLELAVTYNKPVILHAVKAIEPLLATMRSFPGLRGVIHSFYGSYQQAVKLMDHGLLLGIGSAVTHERNSGFRQLVTTLPLERLLIETDAPDQPPAGHRGRRNEPALLIEILDTLASLRSMEAEALADTLTCNTKRLFAL